MKVTCNLKIDCKTKSNAEKVLKSIRIDDFDFVKSKINKNKIEAEIESESVSSIIHTIDDYLACVSVAKKVVDKS
jgi:tRNA threonylcarbamoyladenosine modification (KEOPS) complex  Pcc1 subunit